jgi:hypothetical protein
MFSAPLLVTPPRHKFMPCMVLRRSHMDHRYLIPCGCPSGGLMRRYGLGQLVQRHADHVLMRAPLMNKRVLLLPLIGDEKLCDGLSETQLTNVMARMNRSPRNRIPKMQMALSHPCLSCALSMCCIFECCVMLSSSFEDVVGV